MHNPNHSRRERARAGWLSLGLGCFLIAGIQWDGARLTVPPAVGLLAAGTFVLAGAALLLQARGWDRAGSLASFFVVVAMGGVGAWLGFGPGPRRCSGIAWHPFMHSELFCRIAFGAGALLTGTMGLVMLWSLLKERHDVTDT